MKPFLLFICSLPALAAIPLGERQAGYDDHYINNKLRIQDDESIVKTVGDLRKYQVGTYEDGEVVFMLNKDRTECLKMVHQPGGDFNEYNEFEVYYNKAKPKLSYHSVFTSFVTESGVRLGMTDSAFLHIKGKPKKKTRLKDGSLLLEYIHADGIVYHFQAWIKNDTLRRFRFGEENP